MAWAASGSPWDPPAREQPGVVVSAKKVYGLYWQTSDADWTTARADLKLIFDSFRPAKS